MRIRLQEPAVALTDLAVGLEAAAFAVAVARPGGRTSRPTARARELARWFTISFASTAVAALAGAALHGLFPPGPSPARRVLWRISLGAIGIAGLSAWCLGAAIALPERIAARVRCVAVVAHVAYLLALVRSNPPYSVAVATYLPGAFALGLALVSRLADRTVRGPVVAALTGLGLTFAAAVAQVRRIALHPRLFDHNATYHTIQAIALACFFRAGRGFAAGPQPPVGGPMHQPGGRR